MKPRKSNAWGLRGISRWSLFRAAGSAAVVVLLIGVSVAYGQAPRDVSATVTVPGTATPTPTAPGTVPDTATATPTAPGTVPDTATPTDTATSTPTGTVTPGSQIYLPLVFKSDHQVGSGW